MRKLNGSDIFAALRAVDEAGLQQRFRTLALKLAELPPGERNVKEAGLDGIMEILSAFSSVNAERAVWQVLSGPFQAPAEELAELPLAELLQGLRQLAEENDIAGFFVSFSSMIRSRWRI